MFEQFRDHFTSVFKNIVPRGDADMELVDLANKQSSSNDSVVGNKGIKLITHFDGMKHQSATTNKDGMMMNLSPGQRTILSICILVALQRCNPSPFYCFDEIDADLDSTTTKAIAKLIESISESSQVFMTTFRPESLAIKRSHIYRVEMVAGHSIATTTTPADARELLSRQ